MRKSATASRAERGAVMVIFAIATVAVLLVAALAVDLGVAHVALGKLSKAVDAGALAGARHAASNKGNVQAIVQRVAAANFGSAGTMTASYAVNVTMPATDTYQVSVTGATRAPTLFARLMDKSSIDVVTVADATRYPVDLTLILDISGSLRSAGAFDDLQVASKNFLDAFDDSIDQVGIVTYSTWAWELMTVRKNFKATGKALIDGLAAISFTNIDEGMRVGKLQLDGAPKREKALKIAVLFTDGRPTAFADNLRLDGTNSDCAADAYPTMSNTDSDKDGIPDCHSCNIAATGSSFHGIFTRDNGMKIVGFKATVPTLAPRSSSLPSPKPLRLPGGLPVNANSVRSIGTAQSEEWANAMRTAGYTVYSMGLGDPTGASVEAPDLDFLRRLANDDGIVSSAQPVGEMVFAPAAADLDSAFARLANRILTRLTR